MSTYQKLIDVGAIWKDDRTKEEPTDFYRLVMPDPKRTDLEVMILIDTVFQTMVKLGTAIPLPDKVAESCGKSRITVDEYLSRLSDSGIDVAGLLAFAGENQNQFSQSQQDRKNKAATFFELIQTQWIIEDDDVKKYIDGQSIYDFMQLVLDHADSTRARLKAIRMHATDPKQADKVLVRECWDDWQKQPDRYKGKAAFARDMLDKYENLKSQPVIEGWCRAWEKES